MHEPSALFERRLRYSDFSLTTARRSVYEVLANNEPLSMAQLIEQCSPAIDRASVYRTIKLFESLGIVQRLQIGWKYKLELSNDFQHHHHHLLCKRCGNITVLPEDDKLEKQLLELAAKLNFRVTDHQVEIQGLCESCRKAKS